MKKNSIQRWSICCFAIVLAVVLVLAAGWNYYSTSRVTSEQAHHRAEVCTEMIEHMLNEWGLEKLSKSDKTELYQEARSVLRSVCQLYLQDYLYVYTIDPETNLRHYIFCVAGDDVSDELVRDERYLGAISDEPLDAAEKAIMAGDTGLQRQVVSNSYGHEETWLQPYMNANGSLLAIIGVDYSIYMEQKKLVHDFLLDIVPVLLTLSLGFVIQLILVRRRITNPILAISDSMNRFAHNSRVKPEPLGINTQDEIGEIASAYEKMTEDISAYVANIETLTREKVETNVQLDIARRIQNGLVPEKTLLNGDGFSVCALTRPARAVGGDFYDCFSRDEKTVCIVMGDISGKGLSAAIFMAVVKTMILEKLRACLTPAQTLNEVNDELCARNPENVFATVFACTLNVETGRLTYANAGHTHPVLLGAKPSYLIPESGIALGLFENAGLHDCELTLDPGEGIVLYTDGITETANPENLFFGEERLLKAVSETGQNISDTEDAAEAAVRQVTDAVEAFREDREPFDDAAILVLLRKDVEKGTLSLPVALSSFDEMKKAVFASIGNTSRARQILLVCDELLTNIVSYSGADSLEFTCTKEDGNLVIVFSDNGIPFDPTAEEPEDKSFDLLDSGGMGLSMVRQTVSFLSYKRRNERNELTLGFELK